jgi:glycosyltransferase involved in cell wall biosynthesis
MAVRNRCGPPIRERDILDPMPAREPLSVTVITLNEEQNLDRCLSSVAWADEIVVVDSGSTDRTTAIAGSHGARLFHNPWPGYVAQKNYAIERSRHPWVLSLDADEWVTAAGAEEIRAALANPEADAYAFNRSSSFCGEYLSRAWNPDWQTRLFRRDLGRFDGGRVHERLRLPSGARVTRMRERMPHMAYRTVGEYVERMNLYTGLAAESLAEQGRSPSAWRMLLSPAATFLKIFVLKRGFRDGGRGLIVSVGSAFYVALKYAKLWERTRTGVRRSSEESRIAPRSRDVG